MKSSKLLEIIKKGSFVVPYYLFQLRNELSTTLEEFIFLVYLMNLGNKIVFDTEKMANDLNISIEEIMNVEGIKEGTFSKIKDKISTG